jgi:hypothetical protein
MSHQRVEPWFDRSGQQLHAGLLRRAATLATVATQAATDDVFPRGSTAMGARDNVVQAELVSGFHLAAILTRVIVTREQVLAVEPNRLSWHPIKPSQSGDSRDFHFKPNGLNELIVWLPLIRSQLAQFAPTIEVVSDELPIVIVNDFCTIAIQKRQRSTNVDHADRHVKAIQHQHVGI